MADLQELGNVMKVVDAWAVSAGSDPADMDGVLSGSDEAFFGWFKKAVSDVTKFAAPLISKVTAFTGTCDADGTSNCKSGNVPKVAFGKCACVPEAVANLR